MPLLVNMILFFSLHYELQNFIEVQHEN